MRNIEVFLGAYGRLHRVGLLRRYAGAHRQRVTYEHDSEWLASPDAFQFDPALPLVQGLIPAPDNKELFGAFSDSAPDTWGRELMRRAAHRAADRESRPSGTLQETDYLLGVSDVARIGAFCYILNS